MPAFPPQQRLLFAFGVSLLLHALLIGAEGFRHLFAAPPQLPVAMVIEARLLPRTEVEPLLKDDLAETRLSGRTTPDTPGSGADGAFELRERAAKRKLADQLFYPPEAVARGLEGEVRLLLILDPQGNVLAARVASSSGHALLDRAAADAAYAMHNIPAAGAGELILPVVFKLQ